MLRGLFGKVDALALNKEAGSSCKPLECILQKPLRGKTRSGISRIRRLGIVEGDLE